MLIIAAGASLYIIPTVFFLFFTFHIKIPQMRSIGVLLLTHGLVGGVQGLLLLRLALFGFTVFAFLHLYVRLVLFL